MTFSLQSNDDQCHKFKFETAKQNFQKERTHFNSTRKKIKPYSNIIKGSEKTSLQRRYTNG